MITDEIFIQELSDLTRLDCATLLPFQSSGFNPQGHAAAGLNKCVLAIGLGHSSTINVDPPEQGRPLRHGAKALLEVSVGCSLAKVALFDSFSDVIIHLGPPVALEHKPKRLFPALVAELIMQTINHLYSLLRVVNYAL